MADIIGLLVSFGLTSNQALIVLMFSPIGITLVGLAIERGYDHVATKRQADQLIGRRIPWGLYLSVRRMVLATPPTVRELDLVYAVGQTKMLLNRISRH